MGSIYISMSDYKLVVARYKENIEWIKCFDDYVIFNKGDIEGLSSDLLPYTYSLPNVGKDVEVHLRYIIDNYDKLPSKIAFCQGHYDDHYLNLSVDEFKHQLLTLNNGYSILDYSFDKVKEPHQNHSHFNISHWPDNRESRIPLAHFDVNYDISVWWKQLSGEDYIQKDTVFWGCIFCVERDLIYRRSKSFYEKMHQPFLDDINPVETHFAERSWANIFKVGNSVF